MSAALRTLRFEVLYPVQWSGDVVLRPHSVDEDSLQGDVFCGNDDAHEREPLRGFGTYPAITSLVDVGVEDWISQDCSPLPRFLFFISLMGGLLLGPSLVPPQVTDEINPTGRAVHDDQPSAMSA